MQPLAKYQLAYKLGIINNSFRNKLIELLTEKLVALKNGPVLIIVSEIDHGEILQSGLQNLGIPSKFIYGDKTMDERQEIFDLIKNNQSPVLIGTQLLDTGIDIPNLKYLIYVSGGKSIRQVLQRIGRMLRKTANKKTTTIFDLQDHTTNILYKQAQARVKIYQDEQFEIEG
jgi:superfamily II DNA or RNA helicase